MIFIDTSGVYALADKNDQMHRDAVRYYSRTCERETFVLTLPVVTEACWLIEARLTAAVAQTFWEDVVRGVFVVHPLDLRDLERALTLERAYSDAGFGFADACSLAACERLGIRSVFTFDRRDFSIYRTPKGEGLDLVP